MSPFWQASLKRARAVDDSVAIDILEVAARSNRSPGVRQRILVVTVSGTGETVTILVVIATVLAVAVLVDAVAKDFLRSEVALGIMIVAVVRRIIPIAVRIARIDSVAVFVDAIATHLKGSWVSTRIVVVAIQIGLRTVAI